MWTQKCTNVDTEKLLLTDVVLREKKLPDVDRESPDVDKTRFSLPEAIGFGTALSSSWTALSEWVLCKNCSRWGVH